MRQSFPLTKYLDLDSLASSIAYAWIQTEVHKKPTIPFMQIERNDLSLRAENIYAFKLAGLDDPGNQLLFVTDLAGIKPFPSQQFALVDHNRLGPSFASGNPTAQVVGVVDHHEDENLYTDTANPRTIAPAGSCTSHVAGLCPPEVPAELATLLLCGIFIDTGGLKPGGKALQVDREAASFLVSRSTYANSLPPKLLTQLSNDPKSKTDILCEVRAVKDLTNELLTKKFDVSHLGAWDLLRRDYKEYIHKLPWAPSEPSIKVGLSTVPVGLESWGTEGRLAKEAQSWMKHRGLSVHGVLTSFRDERKLGKSGKGKHRREMVWLVRKDVEILPGSGSEMAGGLDFNDLASRLWKGLEDNKELKLKKHKKFDIDKEGNLSATMKTKVYEQRNVNATRRAIAPILKTILENSTPPPLPVPGSPAAQETK